MLQNNESFQDWLFRYQHVFRVRRSDRQKKRVIQSLVADLLQIRKDVQVIEYDTYKKGAARNIYVGDIEKADKIVCTYYDTPPIAVGDYTLFDRENQKKNVTIFMVISSMLMLLLGAVFLYKTQDLLKGPINWSSPQLWLIVFAYFLYFFLFGKVTRGLSSRKNLIRNTTSIIALLSLIEKTTNNKTAFAFIDEGAYGERGLQELREYMELNCQIYFIESIGSEYPLYAVGPDFEQQALEESGIQLESNKGETNYLFSGFKAKDTQKESYILDKKALNKKQINMKNIEKMMVYFK